jgi:nitrite reductase (NADH) large subunit
LIVGGSIAGITCAQRLRQLHADSEVAILSEEKRPYSKMSLPYLLSGEVKRRDIWLEIPEGVRFLGEQKVRRLFPEEKKVVTEQGLEFEYDKLLIASGASASLPDFEGSSSRRVFTIRNISDIYGIKEKLKKSHQQRVIISGAGLVSIEIGNALLKLGFKPVFLISSNRVLSQILDEEGSEIVKKNMIGSGAELHFGETIKRIHSVKQGIVVETGAGKEFKSDIAIIGKGTFPNTGFLSDSGIVIDNGITVDNFLETSMKDVFAAGDVCQAYDILRRENRVNAIWPVAIEQGKCAAMNMSHFGDPYEGSISKNIVTAFGDTIFSLGMATARGYETHVRKNNDRYVKIVMREGKLVGAVFINANVGPGAYLYAAQKELDVTALKDEILSGTLSYVNSHQFLGKSIGG